MLDILLIEDTTPTQLGVVGTVVRLDPRRDKIAERSGSQKFHRERFPIMRCCDREEVATGVVDEIIMLFAAEVNPSALTV
jgi:hypothetical protein